MIPVNLIFVYKVVEKGGHTIVVSSIVYIVSNRYVNGQWRYNIYLEDVLTNRNSKTNNMPY